PPAATTSGTHHSAKAKSARVSSRLARAGLSHARAWRAGGSRRAAVEPRQNFSRQIFSGGATPSFRGRL
ncbi:MAG: hypothetical protein ABR554_07370, partial [Pyrinomonadaceae bacterium]